MIHIAETYRFENYEDLCDTILQHFINTPITTFIPPGMKSIRDPFGMYGYIGTIKEVTP